MNRLEDDLRIALRRHALDANAAAAPAWEPPARQRPWGSRPWFLPTVAVGSALVFVVVAGVAVTALTSSPTKQTPDPIALSTIVVDPSPPSAIPTPTPTKVATAASSDSSVAGSLPDPRTKAEPKAATKAVDPESFRFRGVAVYPPARFVEATEKCTPDARWIVVVGDPADVCVPKAGSGVDIVWLLPAESKLGAELTPLLNRRIVMGYMKNVYAEGDCSDCGEATLDGASALYFKDQRVVVAVTSPDEGLAESVLAGAHVPGAD